MKLTSRLQAAAETLTDRVLREMYEDPFWLARFGERAEKHGRRDGLYHIQFLVEALTLDDVTVIERYARWLQQLLTTRGMCTRHIDENFARLAIAITETVEDSAPAVAMLEAARKARLYAPGPARTLQDHAMRLAKRAATDRVGIDDFLDHLSYAADAIQLGMPSVFTDHLTWTAAFNASNNIPPRRLNESIATLQRLVASELPGISLPQIEFANTPQSVH